MFTLWVWVINVLDIIVMTLLVLFRNTVDINVQAVPEKLPFLHMMNFESCLEKKSNYCIANKMQNLYKKIKCCLLNSHKWFHVGSDVTCLQTWHMFAFLQTDAADLRQTCFLSSSHCSWCTKSMQWRCLTFSIFVLK